MKLSDLNEAKGGKDLQDVRKEFGASMKEYVKTWNTFLASNSKLSKAIVKLGKDDPILAGNIDEEMDELDEEFRSLLEKIQGTRDFLKFVKPNK